MTKNLPCQKRPGSGLTIEADWGDIIQVHVANKMENNGTSLHFYGRRVIPCPISLLLQVKAALTPSEPPSMDPVGIILTFSLQA